MSVISYTRIDGHDPDGSPIETVMVRVAPHQYVSKDVVKRLGLARR